MIGLTIIMEVSNPPSVRVSTAVDTAPGGAADRGEIRHGERPIFRRRWPMADGFLIVAGIVAMGMVLVVSVLGRARKDRKVPPTKERLRRGTGHALLGLQQFIEPSVQHIFAAQNVEQKDEEGDDGLGEDEDLIRADLAEALGHSPVDIEEIRRHLAAAARAGLDWRTVYEEAVSAELRERPYRAPSMPPPRRVRPRE
jgi:hypothetical protein